MTRSRTELISFVQFSFKSVFDPVRRTRLCVCAHTALFSFHYGRFSRFYIFVIADTNRTDRVGETFIAVYLNVRSFYVRERPSLSHVELYKPGIVMNTVFRLVCSLLPEKCVSAFGKVQGSSPGGVRARAAVSLAFFAAPECGNAAAGGAAEIAARHPPATMHLDASLCFNETPCLTYVRGERLKRLDSRSIIQLIIDKV